MTNRWLVVGASFVISLTGCRSEWMNSPPAPVDAAVPFPDAGAADTPTEDAGSPRPFDPADGGPSGEGGGDITPGWRGEDPGMAPWELVPEDRVAAECLLDPAALAAADRAIGQPYAVIRFGRLCHEYRSDRAFATEAYSTTKTLGALVAGAVAWQTRAYPRTGRQTGPLSDFDRVDHWLDRVPYNPDARIAHVLAMVAHNDDLSEGQRRFRYDTIGRVQLNSMSDILSNAIAQDHARLGDNLEDFTQRHVFGPLGIQNSSWTLGSRRKIFAFSWRSTVRDMARVGLLMLRGGAWNGQRLVDEGWIYRMTHPAFEDANTGMGCSTWLNASSNHTLGAGSMLQQPINPGRCAPVSLHMSYPHGLSDAPSCNYRTPYDCEQELDVGVWQAVGAGGQIIQGHPGLDMVIVARDVDLTGGGSRAPSKVWNAVRPAVVALDPTFAGNEDAFCEAYGDNRYGPFQGGVGAPPRVR